VTIAHGATINANGAIFRDKRALERPNHCIFACFQTVKYFKRIDWSGQEFFLNKGILLFCQDQKHHLAELISKKS
jgi:hypothetical protein